MEAQVLLEVAVPLGLQVSQAPMEHQGRVVVLERAERTGVRGRVGVQVLQGHPVRTAHMERQGHQEVQEPRAVAGHQEKKAKRGRVVLQAPPAPQVKVAHRALPDHRVTRAVQERVVLQAPLEHQV